MSLLCGLSATKPVSATVLPRLRDGPSEVGAFCRGCSGVGDSVFRGICSGLVAG